MKYIQSLVIALIISAPVFGAQTQHVCYDAQNNDHPAHGTVFCDSTDILGCRDGYFARNITVTSNREADVAVNPKLNQGVLGAAIVMTDELANYGVTLNWNGDGTYSQDAETSEIRLHFRTGKTPSNCDTPNQGANTSGNSNANGRACPHGIGEDYQGYEGFQYTRGHVKCDIYFNTERFIDDGRESDYIARTVMHEIGHCLGFHHITGTSNRDELMYGSNRCEDGFSSSTQNCNVTSKFRSDIRYGYEGFLALPQGQPFTPDSTWNNLKYNWTPYQRWFDEDDCDYSTLHSEQLHNGSSPTIKRTADGSRTCTAKLYYWSGLRWVYTSLSSTCAFKLCKAECN